MLTIVEYLLPMLMSVCIVTVLAGESPEGGKSASAPAKAFSRSNTLTELVSDISDEEADNMELDGVHGCTKNWDVDHLKLTVQWGPGVCSSGELECAVTPKAEFKIHGLWPQMDNNLAYCCSDKIFSVHYLQNSIQRDMSANWPSFTSKPNPVFWTHEWMKHGTCAEKVGLTGPNDYFEFALSSFQDLAPNRALKVGGIKPSNNKLYDAETLIDALSYFHGRRVALRCKTFGSQTILTEVTACFNSDLQPDNCPPSSKYCMGKLLVLENKLRFR